jgi:hypothetical protein
MRCLKIVQTVCNSVKNGPLWSLTVDRSFHVDGALSSPRFRTRNDEPSNTKEDDIKTLEDIEKNLFESPKHRPITKDQQLDVLQFEQNVSVRKSPKKQEPKPPIEEKPLRFDEKLGLQFLQLDRRDKRLR